MAASVTTRQETNPKEWFGQAVGILVDLKNEKTLVSKDEFSKRLELLYQDVTNIAQVKLTELADSHKRAEAIDQTYSAIQAMNAERSLTLTQVVALPFFSGVVRSDTTKYHDWLVTDLVPRSLDLIEKSQSPGAAALNEEKSVVEWFARADETIISLKQLETFKKSFGGIPKEISDLLFPERIEIGKSLFLAHGSGKFSSNDCRALSQIFQADNPDAIIKFAALYRDNILKANTSDGDHRQAWTDSLIAGWSILEKKLQQ